MTVSTVTLAKRIKATLSGHDAIVARDGTSSTPAAFNFNFGGELEDAAIKMRGFVSKIHRNLKNNCSFVIPQLEDESREAQAARHLLYAVRAIFTISNSPCSILLPTFQNRTYAVEDLEECIPLDYETLKPLEGTTCFFQFKRHAGDNNDPWVYSWMLIVENTSISRGSKQPIHKLISALLKLIPDNVSGSNPIQAALAELAKMKGTARPYYWHLSNKNTAMYYHAFSQYASLNSCMSKPAFYNHTGRNQHPMDCYDNSPDWSMMMLSEQSPQEINDMCDLVIANPDDADSLFKFPFLTRCLVLPTSLETSGRNLTAAPYIMGKFYGQDKLLRFFYNDGDSAPYHNNNNGLLMGAAKIDGGRIHALPSNKEEGVYMLPYFDKANKARLVKEGTNTWWISVGTKRDVKEPVAQCSYEYGSAKFCRFHSLGYGGHYALSTYRIEMIDTLFGQDLAEFADKYKAHTVNGASVKIPESMFIMVEGQQVLQGEATSLYDGTMVLTTNLISNPNRFKIAGSMGIFDMDNSNHAEIYSRLEALTPTATAIVAATEAPEFASQTVAPTLETANA